MDRNCLTMPAFVAVLGQARKSLWIETKSWHGSLRRRDGQARKSLWIETFSFEDGIIREYGSGS